MRTTGLNFSLSIVFFPFEALLAQPSVPNSH